MGVFDGQVFINETGDDGKDFWIKEAGNIKQYCRKIPTLDSNNDLRGEFFEGYDSKDLFGICDYDAMCALLTEHGKNLLRLIRTNIVIR